MGVGHLAATVESQSVHQTTRSAIDSVPRMARCPSSPQIVGLLDVSVRRSASRVTASSLGGFAATKRRRARSVKMVSSEYV